MARREMQLIINFRLYKFRRAWTATLLAPDARELDLRLI